MRIAVIGVGSGHGDDAAGLAVVAALASRPLPAGVVLHACERPVPDLLDALAGADAAIVVDAACTGATPGHVSRLARDALARPASPSCHGLGVAEALALAAHLERCPPRVVLVAIEIPPPPPTGATALSPVVRAAIPAAVRLTLEIASAIGERPEASSSAS